ncbi:MAG: hypothetical protein NDJ94_05320 [Vicinamibacteria bacterium]|nr:hypothetical protein [Vicinamibacteria bacterium]
MSAQRLLVRATATSWLVVSILAELGLLIGIGEDFLAGGAWSGVLGVVFISLAVPLYCAVFALPCGLLGGLALLAVARLKGAPWSAGRWAAGGAVAGAAVGAIPASVLEAGLALLAASGAATGAVVAGTMAWRLEAWRAGRVGTPGA